MELNAKLTILERMVEIYDRFVGEFDLACEKYCAHCCTANVTMTTLEGYRILNHLEKTGETHYLETIGRQAHPDRFLPRISINRMATCTFQITPACAASPVKPANITFATWPGASTCWG